MKVHVIAEPGRYLVEQAYSLAVSVIARRVVEKPNRRNSLRASFDASQLGHSRSSEDLDRSNSLLEKARSRFDRKRHTPRMMCSCPTGCGSHLISV
jgi:diaminopimelate decarboxylase